MWEPSEHVVLSAMLSPLFTKTQPLKIEDFWSKIKCYIGGQNQSL
jgi:hypothetical protein